MPNPSQKPPESSKAPNQDKGHRCSLGLQNQDRVKILNIGVPKTNYHIKIKIKMAYPNQELPASSKARNEDLKDMDVLCTLKIEIEGQIWIMGVSKTSDHI